MTFVIRKLGVGFVLAGVAVGLAGPASAEPLEGDYNVTVTDGGQMLQNGSTRVWNMSKCGPDCTHVQTSAGGSFDLYDEGAVSIGVWTSTQMTCTYTLDNASLVLTRDRCAPETPIIRLSLTKINEPLPAS